MFPLALAMSQGKSLTLDQAVTIALERNLSIAQAQNNVAAAQSGVLSAYGTYLPSLSASAGWSRYQNQQPASTPINVGGYQLTSGTSGFSVNNSFRADLSLNYTIFDGFAREASFNKATSGAVSAEQNSLRTRQAIVFQVQSSFVNVLRNEQLVKVNEENLRRDQRQLDRIVESNRVGALSLADVYRQQSQVASDELALITQQNSFDKSKADLLALIGLDVMDDYVISDPTISPEISQGTLDSTTTRYSNASQLTSRALTARPDYKSANETLQSSESGVTVAKSNYMPSVNAFAGYGISNPELKYINDNRSLSWGLNFRWSLFDGFATNQQVQTAEATRRTAEISLVQTALNISVDVKKALLDLDAARKQYDVSLKALVSATEDRKIAEERYNLGAGTLLDLLVANANLVNAEAQKINAAYGFVVAKRNVDFVLGEITY